MTYKKPFYFVKDQTTDGEREAIASLPIYEQGFSLTGYKNDSYFLNHYRMKKKLNLPNLDKIEKKGNFRFLRKVFIYQNDFFYLSDIGLNERNMMKESVIRNYFLLQGVKKRDLFGNVETNFSGLLDLTKKLHDEFDRTFTRKEERVFLYSVIKLIVKYAFQSSYVFEKFGYKLPNICDIIVDNINYGHEYASWTKDVQYWSWNLSVGLDFESNELLHSKMEELENKPYLTKYDLTRCNLNNIFSYRFLLPIAKPLIELNDIREWSTIPSKDISEVFLSGFRESVRKNISYGKTHPISFFERSSWIKESKSWSYQDIDNEYNISKYNSVKNFKKGAICKNPYGRFIFKELFVFVDPDSQRDTIVPAIEDREYIKEFDKHIQNMLKGNKHSLLGSKKMPRDLNKEGYYLELDFRKDGWTKPFSLLKVTCEELTKVFPEFNFNLFYEYIKEAEIIMLRGDILKMKRGMGLGMSNALSTLMNIALIDMKYDDFYVQNDDMIINLGIDPQQGVEDPDIYELEFDYLGFFQETEVIKEQYNFVFFLEEMDNFVHPKKRVISYGENRICEEYVTPKIGWDKDFLKFVALSSLLFQHNTAYAKSCHYALESMNYGSNAVDLVKELVFDLNIYENESSFDNIVPFQFGGWGKYIRSNNLDCSLLWLWDNIDIHSDIVSNIVENFELFKNINENRRLNVEGGSFMDDVVWKCERNDVFDFHAYRKEFNKNVNIKYRMEHSWNIRNSKQWEKRRRKMFNLPLYRKKVEEELLIYACWNYVKEFPERIYCIPEQMLYGGVGKEDYNARGHSLTYGHDMWSYPCDYWTWTLNYLRVFHNLKTSIEYERIDDTYVLTGEFPYGRKTYWQDEKLVAQIPNIEHTELEWRKILGWSKYWKLCVAEFQTRTRKPIISFNFKGYDAIPHMLEESRWEVWKRSQIEYRCRVLCGNVLITDQKDRDLLYKCRNKSAFTDETKMLLLSIRDEYPSIIQMFMDKDFESPVKEKTYDEVPFEIIEETEEEFAARIGIVPAEIDDDFDIDDYDEEIEFGGDY